MARLNLKSNFLKLVLIVILIFLFKLIKYLNNSISSHSINKSNLNFKYNYFYYNITNENNKTVRKTLSKYVIIDTFNENQYENLRNNTNTCKIELNKTNETKKFKQYINTSIYSLNDLESIMKQFNLKTGGKYASDCESEFKIAIIIPYRYRYNNLKVFLLNMHPIFIKQKLNYGIYLIEPNENLVFNRGLIMNIGFMESLKDDDKWDCFIFHDIDMIPEDVRNLYKCSHDYPKHYAVAVSKWRYKTTDYFEEYYGGVNAFTKEQFIKINGFSTEYYGWGGEDDDLRIRTLKIYKKYIRPPEDIGRYLMLRHDPQKFKGNNDLNRSIKDIKTKGISNGLNTTSYKVVKIEKCLLFTRIYVNHTNINKNKTKY